MSCICAVFRMGSELSHRLEQNINFHLELDLARYQTLVSLSLSLVKHLSICLNLSICYPIESTPCLIYHSIKNNVSYLRGLYSHFVDKNGLCLVWEKIINLSHLKCGFLHGKPNLAQGSLRPSGTPVGPGAGSCTEGLRW